MGPNQRFSRIPGQIGRWEMGSGGVLCLTERIPCDRINVWAYILARVQDGVVNSAIMGYGTTPEDTHKGISTPSVWNWVPLARKQSDKPVTVCTIYYGHVQNMSTGCYAELVTQRRGLWVLFPVGGVIQQDGSMLKSETPWVKAPLCRLYQMLLCSPQAQKDELTWRKLFWTCLRLRGFDPTGHGTKTLGYQRAVGGGPISEREQGHWPPAAFRKASRCREPGSEASFSVWYRENPAL